MDLSTHPKSDNAQVHPIFAQMLNTFAKPGPAIIADAQRAAYIVLLQRHNWSYEMSEDPQRYDEGRAQRMELNMIRREIDPDYSVWNQYAPQLHRVEVSE
jgi:hypothetical protein